MDWLDRQIDTLRIRGQLSVLVMLAALLVLAFLLKAKSADLLLAPGILLLGAYALYHDARLLWWSAIAFLPASIEFGGGAGSTAITAPSDLLAIILMVVVLLRLKTFSGLVHQSARHPIVWSLLLFFLWTLITSITAEQPIVGLKFFVNTFWYWAGFFVFSLLIFKHDYRHYRTWLWVTAPVLIMILFYTVGTHATKGFSFKASYSHMRPFYLEHTVYGAALALYFMGYLLLAFESRVRSLGWWVAWGLTGFVGFAFITCYVRGAWGSVIIALGVWVLAKYWRLLRLPFFFLVLAGGIAFSAALNDINIEFTKTQDRTIFEHLQSAFDTETNLSNRERINRWAAAIDMTAERPIVGFGPGGYAFEFAEYQHALKMTEISQRSRNTIGTAHNEILRWSSEMGIPGALFFLILMVVSVWHGVVGYRKAIDPRIKTAYAIAFTTLLTYYIHSFVNNYFGMDKITIPLFMMLALITALDTWHTQQKH